MAHIDSSTAKEIQSGIYAIRYMHANTIYIGQAINFKERWRGHRKLLETSKHPNRHLQSAWNKHGRDAFVFEVLKRISVPEGLTRIQLMNFLVADEQHHIDTYKEDGFKLYNVRPSAGSNLGISFSAEARANMGAARKGQVSTMKGKKHSAESRAKMSQSQRGRKASEETRQKLSARQKGKTPHKAIEAAAAWHRGRPVSDEMKVKTSQFFKGRKLSPEHREKLIESLRGRIVSEETREKHRQQRHSEETRAKMRGRKFSDEHRANIAKAKRGRIASDEARAKKSAAHKGKTLTAEHRAKIGAAQKRRIQKPITEETRAKLRIANKEAWRRRKQAKGRGQLIQGRLFD